MDTECERLGRPDMGLPVAGIALRLFVRFLLGAIFLSTGVSKLAHPRRFQRGIQDYQVLPAHLESKLALSRLLSFCIPLTEVLIALSLISGFLLVPAILLTLVLLVTFSGAIVLNLVRGRHDLSCHCGGTFGEHRISWWLVGRNGLLMAGFFLLLVIPADVFTVETFVRNPPTVPGAMWINLVLPVGLLIIGVLAGLLLLTYARVVLRPSSVHSQKK